MSGNIDRRVVEMRFDNKDFEKNVGQTLISLETLQKALQMSEGQQGLEQTKKGLFNLGKACQQVDTAGMASNVEQISNRFSTLGIIGTSVLQTIGQHIAEVGFNIKSKLIAPLEYIKQGGLTRALNVEQANFQIKGLGIEKNDTASYYTEVMDAVLGTAYSYDVAAKAASQLAASDVGVIEKEKILLNGTKSTAKYFNSDMTKAILGIAGVASMTGSSFDDISQVFTRVAGQGRVMSNDLNSISARGLNAAATLAKYLDKTEAEVRDMVTKGEIDFNTFSAAMTDAFGEHAKDSTQTFMGALEDVKAALARIGADFYGPYLTSARDILNSLTPIVDLVHDRIQPALDLAGKTMLTYSKKATGFLDTITIAGNTLTDNMGNKLRPELSLVQKGIKSIHDSTADLEKGPVNAFKILGKYLGVTAQEAKTMSEQGKISFTDFYDAMSKFASSGKRGASEVKSYLADLSAELRRYENIADNLGLTQDKMTLAFERTAKVMKVDIDKVYEAVGEKLGMTGEALSTAVKKGEVSLVDFRRALTELVKDGAMSDEQFHSIMVDIDSMILPLDKLHNTINSFGKNFGQYFTNILKVGKDSVNLFKDAFKGLADILKGGSGGKSALFELAKVMIQFTSYLAKGISGLIEFGRASGAFTKLHDILLGVNNVIYDALEGLSNWASNLEIDFSSIFNSISKLLSPIAKIFNTITEFATGKITQGLNNVTKVFESFISLIASALSHLTKATTVFKAIGTAIMTAFGVKLIGQMSMFNAIINETANQFRKLGGIGIADLIKKLTASGTGVSTLSAVNNSLWELRDTLMKFQTVIKARTLGIIATAVLELAIAVKMLSSISAGRLTTAVVAIQALMQELVLASHEMGAAQTQGIIKIAFAIRILASSMKILGDMSVGDIAKGVAAIGLLMQMMSKVTTYMRAGVGGDLAGTSKALIAYALALRMMTKPIKQIGEMKIQDIAKGLVAVAVVLQLLSKTAMSFSRFKSGELLKAAGSMMLFGIAINELVIPIELLGHMNIKKLGKGLGAIAAILLELGLFTKAMTKVGYMGMEMMMLAPALMGMAKALVIIGAALAIMGNTANIGTGLSVMFASLVLLAVAMYAMQSALPGAVAMIAVAAALAIIAPPLALLSSLNFGGVVVGLIALAGAIFIFAKAAFILTAAWEFFLPGVAILLALSAAVALLGVGILALGSGMMLLAAAFKTGTDSIIEGLTALAAMLPTITGYLWDFIKGMLAGFIEAAPMIGDALTVIVDTTLTVLYNEVPKIAKVGLAMLVALLEAISSRIGKITNLAIDIIVKFVDTLSSRLGEIATAGANMMIAFFNATADAIATKGPELIASIQNLILSVIEVIAGQIPLFGDYAADAIEKYRQGLSDGTEGVKTSANKVSKASDIKPKNQSANGRQATTTFNQGFSKGKSTIQSTAKSNANAANMKVHSQYDNGRNATQGLIDGLGSLIGSLRAKAAEIANLVDSIIRKRNQIASPSKRLAKTGRYMMEGLIAGLDSLMPEYQNRANNISTVLIGSTNDAINAMNSFNGMNLSGAISQSSDVNLRIADIKKENDKLATGINSLTKQLGSMTETMNSRSLNNYISIDGSTDPEAFADDLIRSFRLNARTV